MASLLSPHWYRIAYLRPRLRAGVGIARQRVRGKTWYVLTDPVSGRHHRFNGAAYALVAACDGQLTIDEVWAQRVDVAGDDAPTQAEAIDVFAQAFAANLFAGDVSPDAGAAMQMRARRRAQQRRAALNPLAFKLPLWNPDAFLDARIGRWRWCFGRTALACVLALLVLGVVLAAWNFGDFAHHIKTQFGHGRVLILMWIAFPLIKALHEAAHAFAVKAYGGTVNEVGITLLFATPVPYVDASAAAAFEDKRERIVVGAAGIVVEALLATLALAAWLLLEPGLLRDIAFVVAFIGGVSTLLVNGNPLLRFDGYHVMCDAFELPNLAQRSTRWWQGAAKRCLVRRGGDLPAEALDARERAWLVLYAPAAWALRGAMLVFFALLLAQWSVWLGLALIAMAVWWTLAKPVWNAARWLLRSPELHGQRSRGLALGVASAVAVLVVVFLLPLPHVTRAPGVVWLPDEALVRPAVDGFIDTVLVSDGDTVPAGTPLLRLSNEPLRLELSRVQAELRQVEVEQASHFSDDAMRSRMAADRVAALSAQGQRLAARVDALELRAAVAGRVAIDARRVVPGRYVAQGQTLAHVLPPGAPLVRALVSNEDVAQVRERPGAIEVALAPVQGAALPAQLERSVPRATTDLPTPALGDAGGGPIALDPSDPKGRTALEPRFAVELRLPDHAVAPIGARAWVSFRHGEASLAELSAQFLRRSFLRHFER